MWLVQTAFFIVFGLLPLRFAMADDFYQPDDPETQRVDAENLALAVLNFKTSANTTSLHLRENDRDKKVCKEVFKLLANDKTFAAATRLKDGPDEEDWTAFLNSAQNKKNAYVRTMIRFPNRFSVHFSFHSQSSVANVRGFHCDVPDWVRALVAEKLGPDKFTFALRRQVLETFIGHLNYPKDGMASGFSFGQLYRYLQQCYLVYDKSGQKKWVDRQVANAIDRVRKEANKGAPTYRSEDVVEMQGWIEKLENFYK